MLTVVDISALGLVAEVDETDVLLVEPGVRRDRRAGRGDRGHATTRRVRAVDVLPDRVGPRRGVLPGAARAGRPARFADGDAAPTPRPGMSAVVRLRVREAADAVTVPAAAVFSADGPRHRLGGPRRPGGAGRR